MQAMTIKETGAEGVYIALADGMRAAEYARKLDAVEASNDMLTKQNDALKDTVARLEAENKRLRQQCRNYRFSRSRAYAQALEAQSVSAMERRERGWVALVFGGLGAVLMAGIVIGVVMLV